MKQSKSTIVSLAFVSTGVSLRYDRGHRRPGHNAPINHENNSTADA